MPDPNIPLDGWDVVGALWKVVLTILGWVGLQQKKRIDELEKSIASKASQETTDKETARLERHFAEHRAETRESFQQINNRLDTVLERLVR